MLRFVLEEVAIDYKQTRDKEHERAVRAKTNRRLAAWSPRHRRSTRLLVVDDSGVPYAGARASADALANYWGPRFSKAPGMDCSAKLLAWTLVSLDPQSLSYDEFAKLVEKCLEDCALGPDPCYASGELLETSPLFRPRWPATQRTRITGTSNAQRRESLTYLRVCCVFSSLVASTISANSDDQHFPNWLGCHSQVCGLCTEAHATNSWVTTRRMAHGDESCRFGCGGDDVLHCVFCLHVLASLAFVSFRRYSTKPLDLTASFLSPIAEPRPLLALIVAWCPQGTLRRPYRCVAWKPTNPFL